MMVIHLHEKSTFVTSTCMIIGIFSRPDRQSRLLVQTLSWTRLDFFYCGKVWNGKKLLSAKFCHFIWKTFELPLSKIREKHYKSVSKWQNVFQIKWQKICKLIFFDISIFSIIEKDHSGLAVQWNAVCEYKIAISHFSKYCEQH